MNKKIRVVDAAKLTRAREKAGYPTQVKAAKALGWSRSRLNNYEKGVSEPDVYALAAMMSMYGVKQFAAVLKETA